MHKRSKAKKLYCMCKYRGFYHR